MNLQELLAWQWREYGAAHRSRINLVAHIVAVPAFLACNVAVVACLLAGRWLCAAAFLAGMALAFGVQGVGHGTEAARPAPFTSPWNLILRATTEQWVTFPRFVLTGHWLKAFRSAA